MTVYLEGGRWASPLKMDAWLTPQKHAFAHLCYYAKVGHSRSNHERVIMEICHKTLTACLPFKVTGTYMD